MLLTTEPWWSVLMESISNLLKRSVVIWGWLCLMCVCLPHRSVHPSSACPASGDPIPQYTGESSVISWSSQFGKENKKQLNYTRAH